MMDGQAMKTLVDTAKEAVTPLNIEPIDIHGHQYTSQKLVRIEVPSEPQTTAIEVSTLAAFVDYVNREGLDDDFKLKDERFVMVAGPQTVVLKSHIFGENKQREDLIIAKAGLTPFQFGAFIPHEEFIIALATKFVQTPGMVALLGLIASVSDENISTSKDDGISQEAIVRAGLALERRIDMPTRPTLRPFRSFTDVEPVESTFLLRARKSPQGPTFALLECDGGDWKPKTTAKLVEFLRTKLSDYLVIG
jgi:hypothetical protein